MVGIINGEKDKFSTFAFITEVSLISCIYSKGQGCQQPSPLTSHSSLVSSRSACPPAKVHLQL